MSGLTRLSTLKAKHRALDIELAQVRLHPSADDLEITQIKNQKLLLKDQIVALEARIRSAFS